MGVFFLFDAVAIFRSTLKSIPPSGRMVRVTVDLGGCARPAEVSAIELGLTEGFSVAGALPMSWTEISVADITVLSHARNYLSSEKNRDRPAANSSV